MTVNASMKRALAPLLVLLAVGFSASLYLALVPDPRIASSTPRFKDGEQNLVMAYNTFKYGVFSDSLADRPNPLPSNRREPLYPILLAAVLQQSTNPAAVSAQCLITAERTC
ncbi:MAG TPA: hypothetical protein V6D19_23210, partial [Stenomitos sp.]